MTLTILGSSSALPTSERYPSAHVLKVHERIFLIDCGEGTQMQLRRNSIRFSRINNIFLSHLHGDHVFGLYGLLSTLNLMGRVAALTIYAPGNYEAILKSHLADFDIKLNYDLVFVPLTGNKEKVVYNDRYITVTAFPLKHRVPTFGFLFREKESDRNIIKEKIAEYGIAGPRIPAIKQGADFITDDGRVIKNAELTLPAPEPLSYAYCSDTMYFNALPSYVKGVTLLYHEATFDTSLAKLAKQTGHSTAGDAAKTALKAGAGRLIIGHFSSRYRNINILVEEARTIFANTQAAIDGDSYEILPQ
jgi:ribonuclease Z